MAIAVGGSFYAFLDAYLYSTLPLEEGDRVVALENQDTRINQPERRSLHDFCSGATRCGRLRISPALEPYSSGAPTTGTLGRRCRAGVIDSIPILMGSFPISVLWGADWLSIPPLLTMCLIEVLYFALCESRWAASPGKAICGLMIVQQGGTPASVWQVIVRVIV